MHARHTLESLPTRSRGPRSRPFRTLLTLAALPLAIAAACSRAPGEDSELAAMTWQPSSDGEVLDLPLAQVQEAIRAHMLSDQLPEEITDRQWKRVRQLYQSYENAPLWFDENGLSERAQRLVQMLASADGDGLALGAYPLDAMHERLATVLGEDSPSAEELARADLIMTATYVSLAEDMLTGQVDPRSVSQGWHIDPQQVDVDSAVARTLRAGHFAAALDSLRPQDDGYDLLRHELARYRELAASGGWQPIPDGPTLRPGQPTPITRLQPLRARLIAEGYLDSAAAPIAALNVDSLPPGTAIYDATLAGAVASFQSHHTMNVDSAVGRQTLEALNLPASYRAGQIAANLERYRWLPGTLGARYVLVNVPAFRVEAYDDGKPVLSMKVVVGAEYNDRSTPAFSDSMSTVVFRPYWNVPESIARNEIYPKAAADPGYMASRRYQVVVENGKRRVRQLPGPGNSLGLVKFLFPNDFAIYLHDTPESALFQQDVRAASHGCIRLEHPARFAEWVLGWDSARVQAAMHDGPDDTSVRVTPKIPVYIVYFTAYDRDGILWFGNDLYDRDRALVTRMATAEQANPAARARVAELQRLVGD